MAALAGVSLDVVWEMARYCYTTLRTEWQGDNQSSFRWIPVTERLPENTEDVLVYRPKMKIEIGITCRINDEWLRYGKDLHGNDVITHWMPLPEPPEVE
jgi:hypothetical protein